MAASLNKVTLIGHLGKDPEGRLTNSGTRIVSFSLATSESWNDRASGERKERTEWHRVVIFNEKVGEIAERYCQKGSKVYVEGSLATRKWIDDKGIEKYSTEIVLTQFNAKLLLLDGRSDGEGGRRAAEPKHEYTGKSMSDAQSANASWGKPSDVLDDEIPF